MMWNMPCHWFLLERRMTESDEWGRREHSSSTGKYFRPCVCLSSQCVCLSSPSVLYHMSTEIQFCEGLLKVCTLGLGPGLIHWLYKCLRRVTGFCLFAGDEVYMECNFVILLLPFRIRVRVAVMVISQFSMSSLVGGYCASFSASFSS